MCVRGEGDVLEHGFNQKCAGREVARGGGRGRGGSGANLTLGGGLRNTLRRSRLLGRKSSFCGRGGKSHDPERTRADIAFFTGSKIGDSRGGGKVPERSQRRKSRFWTKNQNRYPERRKKRTGKLCFWKKRKAI